MHTFEQIAERVGHGHVFNSEFGHGNAYKPEFGHVAAAG